MVVQVPKQTTQKRQNKKEEDAADEEAFLQQSIALMQEGKLLVQKKSYAKAMVILERANKAMPKKAETKERADLDANRAICFVNLVRHADAVSAATDALHVDADNLDALRARATAYEQTGNNQKARKDIEQCFKLKPDDQQIKQLYDLIHGGSDNSAVVAKTPAGLGGMSLAPAKKQGGGANKKAASAQAEPTAEQLEHQKALQEEIDRQRMLQIQQQQQLQQRNPQTAPMIHVKAKLNDDSRMCLISSAIGYRDLVTALTNKFPDAGQFTIKYADENGDLRSLQSREDFQMAIHWTSVRLSKIETPSLAPPCVKLTLVELTKIEDMAILGEDGKPIGLPPNEVVEIDEWILDFAALFREHLGIDAEAHLDLHSDGLDKCSLALEPTKTLEESNGKDGILAEAALKFQEAAAVATYNWGNVHMCSARKKMDGGREPPVEEGGNPGAAIATASNFKEVEAELAIAASRFEAALEIKPDFIDASTALAQRRYERARLLCAAAGLSGPDSTRAPEKGHDPKKRTAEAEKEFSQAVEEYRAALKKLPDEPPRKPKTAEELEAHEQAVKEALDNGEEPPVLEEPSMRAQVLVMLGNTLFEQSQMQARCNNANWKSLLEEAVENFKNAGCNQPDIDAALKVHKGNLMEAAAK